MYGRLCREPKARILQGSGYAYFSIGHAGWEMAVRNLGIKEELGGEV